MARKRSAGKITLEEIRLEGGVVIPVTLEKETGTFEAVFEDRYENASQSIHSDKTWRNKDLEKLRQEVKAWHHEKVRLKWEPVIVLWTDPNGNSDLKVLGCSFERLMRAKKLSGDDYEWRYWAISTPDEDFVYKEDLEVYAPSGGRGKPKAWGNNPEPVVMPYTGARWTSLLNLIEMEEALRSRLRDIMSSDEPKIDGFLDRLNSGGLLAFRPKGEA